MPVGLASHRQSMFATNIGRGPNRAATMPVGRADNGGPDIVAVVVAVVKKKEKRNHGDHYPVRTSMATVETSPP